MFRIVGFLDFYGAGLGLDMFYMGSLRVLLGIYMVFSFRVSLSLDMKGSSCQGCCKSSCDGFLRLPSILSERLGFRV